jgi:negative regulator of sigma E activity
VSISREQLMRYHDGELSEADARLVEAALEREPALLEELDAYSDLGSFMRAWDQSNANKVVSFDIADSVLAALEPPRARVHSLLPRIATWVSLGAAIAAGSVLVVRSWSAPPPAPAGVRSAEHAVLSGSAAPSASAAELAAVEEERALLEPPPPPATIESVDFGSNTGEVFVLSTDTSETPVVWMPDDGEPDEDNEDRSESL